MTRPKKPKRDNDIEKLVAQTDSYSNADIYNKTFLCRGTIARLRSGKTRYPNHMTMVGVAAAVGLEWRLVKK
jgi:hypothetical protein